jgi:hypothetical protein
MSAEWGPDPVRAALTVAVLLVGVGAAACGGDTDAPSNEGSLTAFCEVFPGSGFNDHHQILQVAAELGEIGPLPDMPEEARRGLEFFVDNADRLDESSNPFADEKAFRKAFGNDAATQMEALWEWSGPACEKELVDSQLQ